MEPRNLNKTPEKKGEKPKNGYNTINAVHSKFSNLVSSKAVYYVQHSPKTRYDR